MKAENFSLPDYCKRINYAGPLLPDATTLRDLMRHQGIGKINHLFHKF